MNNKPIYSTIIAVFLAIILVAGFNPLAQTINANLHNDNNNKKNKIMYENDFDKNTLEVFDELFEDCPNGIILYKYQGDMVVICMLDSVKGKFFDKDGNVININIDIKNKNINKNTNNNNNDNNNSDNGNGNNNTSNGPDQDCLFDPFLPKCASDNGECPEGFGNNEDDNCVPLGGCPDGYHTVDWVETGQCHPNSEGCPPGMELRFGGKTCSDIGDPINDGNNSTNGDGNGDGNGNNNNATQQIEQEQEIPLIDLTQDPVDPVIPLIDIEAEAAEAETETETEDTENNSEEIVNEDGDGNGDGNGNEEQEQEDGDGNDDNNDNGEQEQQQ